MAIETAGQQKYADLAAKRIKSLQTGMIVWISLLCVALICSFNNIKLAAILGVIAIAYAVLNMKGRKEFKNKLNRIKTRKNSSQPARSTGCIGIKRRAADRGKRLCCSCRCRRARL